MTGLTRQRTTILKTALMRENNKRGPLTLPTNAMERKPYEALVADGLAEWKTNEFHLTDDGRDLAFSLSR